MIIKHGLYAPCVKHGIVSNHNHNLHIDQKKINLRLALFMSWSAVQPHPSKSKNMLFQVGSASFKKYIPGILAKLRRDERFNFPASHRRIVRLSVDNPPYNMVDIPPLVRYVPSLAEH